MLKGKEGEREKKEGKRRIKRRRKEGRQIGRQGKGNLAHISPILQMKRLRVREVQCLVQGHVASEGESGFEAPIPSLLPSHFLPPGRSAAILLLVPKYSPECKSQSIL